MRQLKPLVSLFRFLLIFSLFLSCAAYAGHRGHGGMKKVIYMEHAKKAEVERHKDGLYKIELKDIDPDRYLFSRKKIISIAGPIENTSLQKAVVRGSFFGFDDDKPVVFKFKVMKIHSSDDELKLIIEPMDGAKVETGDFKNAHLLLVTRIKAMRKDKAKRKKGYTFISIDAKGYEKINKLSEKKGDKS